MHIRADSSLSLESSENAPKRRLQAEQKLRQEFEQKLTGRARADRCR